MNSEQIISKVENAIQLIVDVNENSLSVEFNDGVISVEYTTTQQNDCWSDSREMHYNEEETFKTYLELFYSEEEGFTYDEPLDTRNISYEDSILDELVDDLNAA